MPSEAEATQRWLEDIRHHIELAQDFTRGLSYEAFSADNLRPFAVTRCLEIISEASRRLPEEVKARHPSIAWREMAAGNVYRHDYESVLARRVWRTATMDLQSLLAVVERELAATRGEAEPLP